MIKISIIGTNGFLSTAIAKYANQKGWHLNMYGLMEPTGHKYDNYYPINLVSETLNSLSLLEEDIIVYASGAGIQSNLIEGADLIYKLNVSVPVDICNSLKACNYGGIFITFGSVFEMGVTDEKRLFSEEDILCSMCPASNDYAISKRMLSRFISGYNHSFTHWHFIIPTIYGAGENPSRLIPYTCRALINNEQLSFTSGSQTRQYVYVEEVPKLIDLAFQKKLSSGVYNIEGSETITVKELVQMVHDYLHISMADDCFGRSQREDVNMKYLALDGSKLRKEIGFIAKTKILDVIQEYIYDSKR